MEEVLEVASSLRCVLAGILMSGCGPAEPRYRVTERPLELGIGTGLCLAIDPLDSRGVWWWGPGASGCDTRSTGPGVFHGERAHVSVQKPGGQIEVSFTVQLHATSEPYDRVIRLLVEGDSIRVDGVDASTRLRRRSDLTLSEEPPRRSR